MFAQVGANEIAKHVPGPLNELARQGALWREVSYRQDSELFGEAEPAYYVYQMRQGAVRTYKRLSNGRRQIDAFASTRMNFCKNPASDIIFRNRLQLQVDCGDTA
jgi:CRP/FNR family nitrogen fixation transcriptional regulator